MHEKRLYEYAVVRYVPDIVREEFVNVGLLMMCKKARWIRFRYEVPEALLSALGASHSAEEVEEMLSHFRKVAEGEPICRGWDVNTVEERFRWLSAVKSSCIQTSRPHPGLSDNLDEDFERMYEMHVSRPYKPRE